MAPSRPQASRVSSSRSSFYDGGIPQHEQAGRSSTNLHAQASAASLREAQRSSPLGPSRTNSSPNLLRKKTRPQSPRREHPLDEEILPVMGPQGLPVQPPTQAAAEQPSPNASLTSRSRASDSSSSGGRSADTQTPRVGAAGFPLHPPPPPPPPPPRVTSSRLVHLESSASSSSLARTTSPRSIRDLGQDYTRFYNPFATCNNSTTDITTPLPRSTSGGAPLDASFGNGVAGQELGRRLSNPFDDEKSLPDGHKPRAAAGATVTVLPLATSLSALVDENDPEKMFFPYLDDRLGAPDAANRGYNFPLYWDEPEDDDDMHLPMIDDDKKLKAHWRDHFSRDNIISTFGLLFMILGLLTLFVVLPVLSATGLNIIGYTYDTPKGQVNPGGSTPPVTWATVDANRTWPLLNNVRRGLIDPDTPSSAMTTKGVDGTVYNLVFSDEFNEQNRTFYPGDDPYFFAPDIWYGATQDLEWYDPDAVTTWGGALELQLDKFPNHGLQFRSGMLNSWNQLCFKGGIFEVSVSLPGPGGVHGLWPGVWSMGNLGRPGYLATSDGMWPYTYNDCDVGITPNQSSPDGINNLPGQRLTSCGCPGSDHPTPGTGRGAPEIDIIEVSGDWGGMGIGVATQSFQVAPFDVWWYPNYDFMATPDYATSFVNTYTGGPFQQAVSTTTMLNNSWYDGKMYQKYSYEYTPGSGSNASISWVVGDQMTMQFDGRAIGPNGNIGQRLISEEPMSLVFNLGISNSWVDINWAALVFPTIMRVDYVRWYQKEGDEMVTCDPPGYETTEYIKKHPEAYNNPNYTRWTDIPGYTWPKNKLMHTC